MIVLKNITKKYKSNIIIESFSYTFNDTGLYGITGKSGVGKTTLLNIISNIIKPTSGEVYYTSSINQISQEMSYIYQNFNLFDNLTIIENINLVLKIHNIIKTSMEIVEILTIVGIEQLKEAKAFELSGGERQRLSISLALLCDSKVIIADEPVSNLDEKNSFEIMNLLKKISKTKLVIMSTHNKKDLINFCDKIINLEDDKFTSIKELADINPQIKQKKCKTSFMTCLYIRKKIIKTQKVRLIFSFIIFVLLIFLLSFSMSASRIDKTYLTEKALNSEEYKGFYITGDNEEYISDLNLINKQDGVNYKEVGFIHACTILFQDNGSANQGSMTFSNVVFDSNYDFNKIGLTYYDCDKLKEAGVLNFVDYKDCLGKSLIINNKNLNISKLVNKNSANSGDLTTYKKEFLYQNIYMSKKTSIMLFGNRENIIMPVNQTYTEILENESLTGNEISISKMAFKELFDSTDYSSLLGKEIELSFDLEECNFKNKFIIKEVSENIFNNISFSTEEFENIYYKENGFINESEFERTYYIDSWENNDLLKLALDNIYDNNLNVLFATSSELDSLYNEMHSLIILFKIISILIICLTLLFISYLVYNMYYINRAQFEALRLFGVSKLSLFIISLIDLLIPLVASIIIGTCLTFIASKKFVDLLVTNANVSFSFSVFDIRFIILSVLIICITIICASIIPFILKNKETSTYIRKN